MLVRAAPPLGRSGAGVQVTGTEAFHLHCCVVWVAADYWLGTEGGSCVCGVVAIAWMESGQEETTKRGGSQ